MLKKLFALFLVLTACWQISVAQAPLKLWYQQPAKVWTEALPLGNGRLGAMVFGRPDNELIQLNETTLWSGGPVKTGVNPDAPKYLEQVRGVLLADNPDYTKANALARKMQGIYSEAYLPLGDLQIKYDLKDSTVSNYYRDLNISDAVATTRFTIGNVEYTRQVFSSAPDQVIVIRLTASKPGMLSFTASAKSLLHYQNKMVSSNELAMEGKAPLHEDPNYVKYNKQPVIYEDSAGHTGMRYQLRIKALNEGGSVTTDTAGVHVSNSTAVTILLSAATSFNGFDKRPDTNGADEKALARAWLQKAEKKNFQELLSAHQADFHRYFDRVKFSLQVPADNANALLPTNERLVGYTNGAHDPSLETLYFQYGRYLLISCSRPGGVPANLQGIWNKELRASWSSNYTTNINVQMNYWPAEPVNLSEMHEPLFDLIHELAITGKVTAHDFYNAHGWVVHHNSDIWALSNPVGDKGRGDPKWANWNMGAPWLSRHLWEHYLFTQDKAFLQQSYPLMKGAAEFLLDYMVTYKGYLVTAPSVSPENDFIDGNGKKGNVSLATTMDMSIVRDLFESTIRASRILNTDAGFRNLLIQKQAKLYPFHIGKKGNLQEWYQDWEDVDPHHRHVSHLYGLHPGYQISPITTPDLANAARKTLELRGDEGTGWSLAWKINFWARLLDGNHAYSLVRNLLRAAGGKTNGGVGDGSGSYPNLFDAHPPFQIDGNFGGVSGISEMLLQSHLDEIHLLPALPDEWANGQIAGLKARGNFEVAMVWKDKKLVSAEIKSVVGGICKIRSASPFTVKGVLAKPVKDGEYYLINFNTVKGNVYLLTGK